MDVADADAAQDQLLERGVEVAPVIDLEWGRFVYCSDPDGTTWSIQRLTSRS